jgi:hypothetical protein
MGPQKKEDFMAGLRVIWPDAKPSEEVMKTVKDLRKNGLSPPALPPCNVSF